MSHKKNNSVQIVEVGLRDGLQSEKIAIGLNEKLKLAQMLTESGLTRIELGSFVRSDWVPQMSGSFELIKKMNQWKKRKFSHVAYSALVPNTKGLDLALQSGVKEIAIFASCSEAFSKANLNASRIEVHKRYKEVSTRAHKEGLKLRGYLSVCFGCPFEGFVSIKQVQEASEKLFDLGCYEVSLGDTIGVARVGQIEVLLDKLSSQFKLTQFAGHFHDTRGQALLNVYKSYEMGLRVFDSSFGGLGGCPYAPASTGNIATEELVYMFESLGISTQVDLKKLIQAGEFLSQSIQRPLPSRYWRAESKQKAVKKAKK